MLYSDHARAPGRPDGSHRVLAVSQPAHALISGQILKAWARPLAAPLVLAAELHDIAWLDWETAPSFDPATGRPHSFRDVGAARHAPMWETGVDRALAAWGQRVALLISRHGSLIYTRHADRDRMADEETLAASHYLRSEAGRQAQWTRALGLDEDTLVHDTGMIAFSDAVSLALCGALKTPLAVELPVTAATRQRATLTAIPESEAAFTLAPWPFAGDVVTVEAEARPLPQAERLPDEAAMRAWLAAPDRVTLRARLVRS